MADDTTKGELSGLRCLCPCGSFVSIVNKVAAFLHYRLRHFAHLALQFAVALLLAPSDLSLNVYRNTGEIAVTYRIEIITSFIGATSFEAGHYAPLYFQPARHAASLALEKFALPVLLPYAQGTRRMRIQWTVDQSLPFG